MLEKVMLRLWKQGIDTEFKATPAVSGDQMMFIVRYRPVGTIGGWTQETFKSYARAITRLRDLIEF